MPDISITPNIEVTIGRQTRLYHAFITTAPAALDAPSTLTLYAGPLKDVAGFAVEMVPVPPVVSPELDPTVMRASDDSPTADSSTGSSPAAQPTTVREVTTRPRRKALRRARRLLGASA